MQNQKTILGELAKFARNSDIAIFLNSDKIDAESKLDYTKFVRMLSDFTNSIDTMEDFDKNYISIPIHFFHEESWYIFDIMELFNQIFHLEVEYSEGCIHCYLNKEHLVTFSEADLVIFDGKTIDLFLESLHFEPWSEKYDKINS